MEEQMDAILGLITRSVEQVVLSLVHNWPYLLLSVLIAAALKLYVNADRVSAFLSRHRGAGVVAATAAAVGTPLCSCGTTAVVLGMMATTMPWAPIVAFMVASPLTSPEGVVYTAGLFGWPFSIAFFVASIVLGLGAGWITALLESRGWLANQTRFAPAPPQPVAPAGRVYSLDVAAVRLQTAPATQEGGACGCSTPRAEVPAAALQTRVTPALFFKEAYEGGRRLLGMFVGFAFIGYFLNGLIPAAWVSALFGGGSVYNVPLAATLGLPFYINSEASLPLVRALIDNGMSPGAALAFLIAGSGTSIGAITGAMTIARWRIVGLVVGLLWVGAILSGLVFDLVRPLALA
jgi:uncharacterized membrane protein YraQ (UPF0718 family)